MNMKRIIFKATNFVLVLFMGNACTDNFEELNTNPALVSENLVKPEMVMTGVLKNSIFDYFVTNTPSNISEYSGYVTNEATGNLFLPCNCTNPFNYYRNHIINLNEVIRMTSSDPSRSNQTAIARVWRAWVYQTMTDAYGDIPYSEAAKDVNNVINQPVYDPQDAIYRDMLNELKEAAASLSTDPSKVSFGNADILYKGNVDLWRRFANSLRLRMAVRVRYADAALAQQHISEVVTQPMIEQNNHNAILRTLLPGGTTPVTNVNPIFIRYLNNGNPHMLGFPISEQMVQRNDPRLPILAEPARDGLSMFRGRPLQMEGAERGFYTQQNAARIGPLFTGPQVDILVMNTAEVYFLRAEAALVSLSGENAQNMYQLGIDRSLTQLGVAEGEKNTYLNSAEGTLNGATEEKLENIIIQKYIAIFPNATEAWAEWRRTGYPKIWTGSEKGATNGNVPRRLTYPIDEYAKNQSNINQAASRMNGGDVYLSRVWWDKKSGLPLVHPKQGQFPPN
jgi:hypothetical protein